MAYSLARYNTGGQHLSFWVLSQRFLPPIAIVLPMFLIYRRHRHLRHPSRPDPRLHGVHPAGVGVDDVRLFPPRCRARSRRRRWSTAAPAGASFWTVAVPLAAPGIVAAAVFAFIACWTEFFFALLLTSKQRVHAADRFPRVHRLPGRPVWRGGGAARSCRSGHPSSSACSAQRHLVRGLTLGAVRG